MTKWRGHFLSVATKKKRRYRSLRRHKRYNFIKPISEVMRKYYSEARRVRKYRKDANHNIIADRFKMNGFTVFDTSQLGYGFPDIVASKGGRNILVEIKSEIGTLTPAQAKFKDEWQGEYYVVRTVEQADLVVNKNKGLL